jgi:hypothetical protein
VAFVEQKMQITQVSEWYSKFKNSVTSVENIQHLQCPPTHQTEENLARAKKPILENRRITIHGVSNMLGISLG